MRARSHLNRLREIRARARACGLLIRARRGGGFALTTVRSRYVVRFALSLEEIDAELEQLEQRAAEGGG